MDVLFLDGPGVDVYECSQEDNQQWLWNATDKTVRRFRNGQCLTVRETREVWVSPLSDGSQAVLLFNRANTGAEPITVKWTDLNIPSNRSALVRDLWARQDLGSFTHSYTSPPINFHQIMMLKITLNKTNTFDFS